MRAASAESPADLLLLAFPLRRSLHALEALAGELDPKLRPRLIERVKELRGLAEGPESLVDARADELGFLANAKALLAENAELSGRLTDAVDRLVDGADRDIVAANLDALSVQRFSGGVLIGVVALSLASSVLIVWLYVGRNLIARLTALSDSMLAIAGGHLRAPLPPVGDDDEIGRMARALAVFRDTAVEIEEQNLREVAQARQRVIDAIESISEGFALYDVDDRLVLCNSRYGELLYPGMPEPIEVGAPFEAVVRDAAARGLIDPGDGDVEAYVRERVARHREPGEPFLQRRGDGRWILISERRTAAGGTVAVYSDMTELKRREIELNELAEQQRAAAEQVACKNRELEALSNKLAKYLAPQVYASIFAGRQEVRLASQRKKLSVLFCDIVGFTETTERLESEDLTHLLNHYLTEMSRLALDQGATVDKYIGDAIMMFFGDPESRGVREDALACLRAALAMQRRMRELEVVWRDAGVEAPLRCRIGVSTAYCTVGNFGSEDRMDYTIVGAGVNLAARLQQAAPAGGILIAYETYALVRDAVCCRESGRIRAKGIADPVAAYEVLDLYENLDDGRRPVREELPNARIELDLAAMSEEERRAASAIAAAGPGAAGGARPGVPTAAGIHGRRGGATARTEAGRLRLSRVRHRLHPHHGRRAVQLTEDLVLH